MNDYWPLTRWPSLLRCMKTILFIGPNSEPVSGGVDVFESAAAGERNDLPCDFSACLDDAFPGCFQINREQNDERSRRAMFGGSTEAGGGAAVFGVGVVFAPILE